MKISTSVTNVDPRKCVKQTTNLRKKYVHGTRVLIWKSYRGGNFHSAVTPNVNVLGNNQNLQGKIKT